VRPLASSANPEQLKEQTHAQGVQEDGESTQSEVAVEVAHGVSVGGGRADSSGRAGVALPGLPRLDVRGAGGPAGPRRPRAFVAVRVDAY